MFILACVFSNFENRADNARIIAFLFVFGLYDPLFTSAFGGIIGAMVLGIRIKKENNHKRNIVFPLAIIRFLTKASLGWISLLTVSGNEKRKAIHDYIAGSVVVNRKN
jgi:uncharacterized RDD family membrane protein YckC